MERLKRRTDFRATATGARAPASTFVLQARARGDEGACRVGFTVSKQVGNAVERNRVRRRLRETVRLAGAAALRAGHDYVLVGRRAALAAPFRDLTRELGAALHRVHDGKQSGHGQTGAATTGASNGRPLHEAGPSSRARKKQDKEH
jgi:ribonuclease P protein component